MTNSSIFETSSRKLEEFLYMHDIPYRTWRRDLDGMMVWVYDKTDDVDRVVNEYREMIANRTSKRK